MRKALYTVGALAGVLMASPAAFAQTAAGAAECPRGLLSLVESYVLVAVVAPQNRVLAPLKSRVCATAGPAAIVGWDAEAKISASS